MIDKDLYIETKRRIKYLCRDNVEKLCDDTKLTKTEKSIIMDYYDGKLKVETCLKNTISHTTYTTYFKIALTKIIDYNKNIL